MSAQTTQLADAIVEMLNAGTWALDFTATRTWTLDLEPETDACPITVSVLPTFRTTTRLTRGQRRTRGDTGTAIMQHTAQSRIVIFQRVDTIRQIGIDNLELLMEQLQDALAENPPFQLEDGTQAEYTDQEADLNEDLLITMGHFLSIIRVNYTIFSAGCNLQQAAMGMLRK